MNAADAPGDGGPRAYRFGPFELRLRSRELLCDGCQVELQPKVFDLIAYLVVHHDRAVDKTELLDAIWPKQVVTEAALTRCVMKARRALDDVAERPQVILTVHGRGYRFVAAVRPVGDRRSSAFVQEGEDMPSPVPDDVTDTDTDAAATTPADAIARRRRHWLWAGPIVLALTLALAGGWWWQRAAERNAGIDGPVRIAVLPIVNDTREARYDWAGLGLMTAIGDILRADGRVGVLGAREILDQQPSLAGLTPQQQLARLRDIHGTTHLLEGRIAKRAGQLRLDYALIDAGGHRRARSAVGADVTALAHAAGADLSVLLGRTPGGPVSEDTFANEAYLRGRAQRLQGDIAGSRDYFRLASQQAPTAFWPRYELALAQRDLGEREDATTRLRSLLTEADAGRELEPRLAVRNALAILLWRAGEHDEAARLLEQALALAEQKGDPARTSAVLTNLGILANYRDDFDGARDYLTRAIEAEAAAGLEKPSGNVLNSLAQVDLREGDLVSAGKHLEGALAQFQLLGDRRNEAVALNALANLRRREGRFEESRALVGHALAVHRELGNRTAEASALIGLAIAEAELGRLKLALEHAQAALALAEEIGERPNAATARSLLGQFNLDLGRLAAARDWFESAHEAMLEADDATGARRQRRHLARLARAEGDPAAAERQLRALRQELLGAGPPPLLVDVLRDLAQLRLDAGDPAGAEARLREALAIAEPLGDARLLGHVHTGLAEVALARNEPAAAERELGAAKAVLSGDFEHLRVRAALAGVRGDLGAAVALEEAAKAAAGERWRAEDQTRLDARRR